jgi:hypothetical protein
MFRSFDHHQGYYRACTNFTTAFCACLLRYVAVCYLYSAFVVHCAQGLKTVALDAFIKLLDKLHHTLHCNIHALKDE